MQSACRRAQYVVEKNVMNSNKENNTVTMAQNLLREIINVHSSRSRDSAVNSAVTAPTEQVNAVTRITRRVNLSCTAAKAIFIVVDNVGDFSYLPVLYYCREQQ